MRLLRKCECRYTLNQSLETCNFCNHAFRTAYPPKFSPHDKYAEYRRRMKKEAKKRGVL
ncbi:MAG: nucleolar RNA-binding Nop10p family protein [Candidatus Hodarchaeales archaeon]|jgi:rRNA maturation protein Nop10